MASALSCILVVMTHVSVSPSIPSPNRRLVFSTGTNSLSEPLGPSLQFMLKKKIQSYEWFGNGNPLRFCELGWIKTNDVPIPFLNYYEGAGTRCGKLKGTIDLRNAVVTCTFY